MTWRGESSELPAISVQKSTAQSISSNVTTLIAYNLVRWSSGGMILQAGGSVAVPRTGWYQISGNVTFSASTASARRIVFIGVGASPGTFNYIAANTVASAQDTAAITTLQVSAAVYMTAGQVCGIAANVLNTAWALDVSNSYMNDLSVAWLGPGA